VTSTRRRWTAADVPDLSGRTAVVTGASGGLGLETASVLAQRGAAVVLGCRDMDKARRAADRLKAEAGPASVRVIRLDLACMASIRDAAAEIRGSCPRLDLLINNAGVMAVPYQRTADGFELTLATNHLGHFALTALVLDRLLSTPRSRVVTVSSIGHLQGEMRFDDLQGERDYQPWPAYWQSKLANLLFTYELQSRLEAAGAGTIALAAHPGNARTELWRWAPGLTQALYRPWLQTLTFWFAHSAHMGALPTLRAAVDPAARGGDYYGPRGWQQYTGYPVRVESNARSHDVAAQHQLWEISEELTGVRYVIPAGSRQQPADPAAPILGCHAETGQGGPLPSR
jgi:NAD(P)-dependent dehydrogenase (short-subunit alcohol dehydrogenase family)